MPRQFDHAVRFGIGTTFGKLVITGKPELVSHSGKRRPRCRVRCECGNEFDVLCFNLSGQSTCSSCSHEKMRFANRTHGFSTCRVHRIWVRMLLRCEDKGNRAYPDYGGRGITVCEEWHDFETFQKWAMSSGYDDSLTIDRKDNDSGYRPDNCRWATYKVNARNRRGLRLVTAFGENKLKRKKVSHA